MAGFYTAQVAGTLSAIDIALSPTPSMAAVAQAATMLPQESASGYREALNPSSAPGSKCAFATGGAVVLTVWDALESCPSGYVRKAAKVFAQGDGSPNAGVAHDAGRNRLRRAFSSNACQQRCGALVSVMVLPSVQ